MIESDLYQPIKKEIENFLASSGCDNVHIEITANNRFSTLLRRKFGEVLTLLDKSFSPDLSGTYRKSREKRIVIEVKRGEITIQNIYQTIAYSELIGADIGVLISPKDIPIRIRNFLDRKENLLQNNMRKIFIVMFDKDAYNFLESSWYPFQPTF